MVLTCQPADPAAKGGVESSGKIAKAEIVPKDTNLRAECASFAQIHAACQAFMDEVNHREHRATYPKPAAMLAEEAPRLHRIPDTAHTVEFGPCGSVPYKAPMVTLENGQYSVPAYLLGSRVFVRSHGAGPDEQIIVVDHGSQGPALARPTRQPGDKRRPLPGPPAQDPGRIHSESAQRRGIEFLASGDGART